MNQILETLSIKSPKLFSAFNETFEKVKLLLNQYIVNFPNYTDHSINHTYEVLNLAALLLSEPELNALNEDELYILSMACILHDIGMCIPEDKINECCVGEEYDNYLKNYDEDALEVYLRDVHHVLSKNFIMREQELLGIPSSNYAKAIGLVAQGHRKVDLQDFEVYTPQFFAKGGRDFACLPYLASILRIADELDVTNMRTPELLLKYYLPNNEISIREFKKHQATMQINFTKDTVIIEAECSDHNILAALEEQFLKIQNVISNCQKVIRSISRLDERIFELKISKLEPKFIFKNFDPKGIKYSFDVKNVINAFVGKDLYGDHLASLREAIQNGLDACNFRRSIEKSYTRKLVISISNDEIKFKDNGNGMDEFIIENYFGKLASSFYEQENIKNSFQAIGQFGIGVFSYFLISDYIEVETKNQQGLSLRFRTDQDPSGYFHFFDGFIKEDIGTTLTLHLKDEYKKKINFSLIEAFIRKNFPFIDMDIILEDDNRKEVISPSSFELDVEKDVVPRMYHSKIENKKDIVILTQEHSDENVEGIMGLILPSSVNFRDTFDEIFDGESFSNANHIRLSEIATSQKGVFVENYAQSFAQCLGKINIKNKLKITLNREGFRRSEDLMPYYDIYEAKLSHAFFNIYLPSINVKSKKKVCDWSKYFIRQITTRHWKTAPLTFAELNNNLLFELRNNSTTQYLTINEIKAKYDQVIVLTDEMRQNPLNKLPYITFPVKDIHSFIGILGAHLEYGIELDITSGEPVVVLTGQSNKIINQFEKLLAEFEIYEACCFANSEKVLISLETSSYNKKSEYIPSYYKFKINCNNKLIHYISDNKETILRNSKNRKLLKETINEIIIGAEVENQTIQKQKKRLKVINDLLKSISLPNDSPAYQLKLMELF